ncbi:MAG: filamentous hemagglutinin N-terminal domain-containing protein, partial [Gammaproteobacteria bacterium]|nr:filamentous hemagglutinin N-terminal domain-containing protein [Gammaproteobacteria bacterium]
MLWQKSASRLSARSGWLLFMLPASSPGQIATDGTLGPAGALPGPDYLIDAAIGQQVGPNLFHSFSEFNVNTGESATFTSAFSGATANVIGRVTGANASGIDGLLRSDIPGAAVWLVNPNGVLFGANAALDVPGAFHATTADVLVLGDGGRFAATDVDDTVLTVADPAAFGFLDASIAPISVDGAELQVEAGAAVSLVGGPIALNGASVNVPQGTLSLQSAAGPGELGLDGDAPRGGAVRELGSITLSSGALATSGGSSGDVYIRGGELVMERGARIEALTTGAGANAGIGDVVVEAVDVRISGGSQVRTGTSGSADGGRIVLDAANSVVIEGIEAGGDGRGAGGGGNGGGADGGGNGDGGTGSGSTGRGIDLTGSSLSLSFVKVLPRSTKTAFSHAAIS